MKKSFIKTAVATALLSAMSVAMAADAGVQVYGRMQTYIESDKNGTADAVNKVSNDLSYIGFRGTEDLGGGLKANFRLETGVFADSPRDSATYLGSRWSTVGLSNSFGSIDLGRGKHAALQLLERYGIYPTAYGQSTDSIHEMQGVYVSNTTFLSATPIQGLRVRYQHSLSEVAGRPDTKGGGLDYNAGPFAVGFASYDNGAGNKTTSYGGEVKLPTGTTLAAIYSNDSVSYHESTGKSVWVGQPITPALTLMAGYGERTGYNEAKAVNVAAMYKFSKRTTLHARYRNDNFVNAALDRKQIGVGIQHDF